jgi:thiol-disulfide isomerase/thioredoxin
MNDHSGSSRRQFIARTASVVGLAGVASAGGLAGCMSREGESGGAAGDGTDAGGASAADTPGEASTPTRLQLETLAVGESPGGSMVVNPAKEATLLDFFATWCAPCKPQMAELRSVRSTFPDLHMLSLTRESDADAIRSFWTEFEGTWPVATDPQLKAFRTYGIKRIPTLVLLDAEGSEVWRHSGLASADTITEKVEDARA